MFVERAMHVASPLDGLSPDQLLLLLRAVEAHDAAVTLEGPPKMVIEGRVEDAEPAGAEPEAAA